MFKYAASIIKFVSKDPYFYTPSPLARYLSLYQVTSYNFTKKITPEDVKVAREEGKNYLKDAYKSFKNAEYLKTHLLLNKALTLYLREGVGEEHPYVVEMYNLQGKTYAEQWEFEKANECYEKALQLVDKFRNKKNKEAHVKVFINLASSYERLHKYNEALKYLDEAKDLIGDEYDKFHNYILIIFNNQGVIYRKLGELTTSYKLLRLALNGINSNIHQDVLFKAKVLANLGEVYSDESRYNDAHSCLTEAKDILEGIKNQNSRVKTQLSICLNDLGLVCYYLEKYIDAYIYLVRARDLQLQVFPEDHLTLGITMHNLALVLIAQKQYQKAIDLLHRVESTLGKNLKSDDPAFGNLFLNLGVAYHEGHGYMKAITLYEKALKNFVKNYGEIHKTIADIYGHLGRAYTNSHQETKALDMLRKAVEIREKLPVNDQYLLASDHFRLGRLLATMGKYNESLPHLLKAANLKIKVFGEINPKLTSLYRALINVYENLGNSSAAEAYLHKIEASHR